MIVTDLGGNELYTWSITIYLLTSTISGPIYGKLSDLFGRRPIFLFAVSLFLVASVLCAFSQEMWQFVLFRGLQGLGGGAIFPVAIAVVADLYTPAERGKYLGFFGAVFGLSSILGPAIGGIITDNFGWQWIFFVNVPLGLVSLFLIWRLLPSFRRADAGRNIDYVGAALFTAAIAPFLVGLTNRQSADWTDPWVGGLMLIGALFLVVFVWWESRYPEPIIPLSLFRNRNVRRLRHRYVPGRVRVLQRSALPAALVPGRRRIERDRVGLQPLAAARRADRQRNPVGPDRGANASLQAADLRLAAASRARAVPADRPSRRHGSTDALAVDAHRRTRHRAIVRGVHA